MDAADLRSFELFRGLSDDRLAQLLALGEEVPVEPGTELFREGDRADSWWLLVDGAIELVRKTGREQLVVGQMLPGRWAGGFRAWDEHGTYLASGRGALRGRALRVPAEALRSLSLEWFPFGVHLIEGLYRTARTVESTARQRDSLVTLGTLAAGLAHELNNPAAAAGRAAEALQETCDALLGTLGQLAARQISPHQFVALDGLRRHVQAAPPVVDPLDLADREEEIAAWLADRGVDREWLLAAPLAAAGADVPWCEQVASALGRDLGPGIEWVVSTLSAARLLEEVRESTRRISELVAAVRSYSQLDRPSLTRTDVVEGLESTLLMLGHRLRRGVVVERDYDPTLPLIEAYAGELNQVWTNLVDNAVDAMDVDGTLRVRAHRDGDAVVVEIGDDGPGMPEEVAARAFETFFTTKEVGKGTGLGLDIARRIVVERHGGTIEIDSRPGDTVLRVRLPVDHG